MANFNYVSHDFYCTQCGNKAFPVYRNKGSKRSLGHLKKLYCLHCKTETNHCEVDEGGNYTYDDFKIEFEYGNFTKEGQRKITYPQLLKKIRINNIKKVGDINEA